MGFRPKEKYDKGDLVLIDDKKGFKEIAVILSCKVPLTSSIKFFQSSRGMFI